MMPAALPEAVHSTSDEMYTERQQKAATRGREPFQTETATATASPTSPESGFPLAVIIEGNVMTERVT